MNTGGQGRRTERRTTRGQARRRRRNKRLFAATAPALVVIAGVVALLIIWGGKADTGGSETVPTTAATTSSAPSVGLPASHFVVAIQEEGTVPVLVLLSRAEQGGLVVGIPGSTLVTTEAGFETLSELYSGGETGALLAGLGSDLGLDIDGMAGVDWAGISNALERVGLESASAAPKSDSEGAIQAAGVMVALLEADAEPSGEIWAQVDITGDGAALREMLGRIVSEMSEGSWRAVVLPGKVVEGVSFEYYETDVEEARALLSGKEIKQPAEIVLEVQNGSGVIDAAQAAGAVLAPLGYTLRPFQNAEDFPNVAKTTISAASDTISAAKKVREALGVGVLVEDASLISGNVMVVVGKDFTPTTTGG